MEETKSKPLFFLLTSLPILFVSGFLIHSFIFTSSIVQGESMFPALEEGDRVLYNKAAYLFEEPNRGDIVIIQRPLKNYVKRIIALPGETIEVNNHSIYINGELYKQNFLPKAEIEKTVDFGPVTVPENHYFVMGDNRKISKDSRNGLGFVSKNEIIGKTEIVIYPLTELSLTK